VNDSIRSAALDAALEREYQRVGERFLREQGLDSSFTSDIWRLLDRHRLADGTPSVCSGCFRTHSTADYYEHLAELVIGYLMHLRSFEIKMRIPPRMPHV